MNPAKRAVANSYNSLRAQAAEIGTELEETHSRELKRQSESDERGETASGPVIMSCRERRKKEQQEKEEAARQAAQQKIANAEPDIILFTTAGHKLVLPSQDLPVAREQLEEWGRHQDEPISADSPLWRGETGRLVSIEHRLWIRGKSKHVKSMHLNRVQREVDRRAGKRNIVLKARQVGSRPTWRRAFSCDHAAAGNAERASGARPAVGGRNFSHRAPLPGEPAAEWRHSALKTSRANVRQIIFPKLDSEYRVESAADRCAGRGLTIQNLHCSEVARWPHDVAETLAALRAAVPPDGEIFLESTPSGAGGTFYEEWQSAPETGYVQHFFPWWWEESYKREIEIVNFTDEELELMAKHGLNAGQIAFRREMRSQFRNRFLEEYAENAETCFLTSGNCMFDCEGWTRR